jgi:hypothetical protein
MKSFVTSMPSQPARAGSRTRIRACAQAAVLFLFFMTVAARASFTLTWSNNDTPADETGQLIQVSIDGGAYSTLATLSATATSYHDLVPSLGTTSTYAYRVCAFNAVGNSTFTNIATNAPTFTIQPPATQVDAVFSTAVITAAAIGIPAPTYQWYKNGTIIADVGNVSGSATASLSLSNLSSTDQAVYTVVAHNGLTPDATSTGCTLTTTQASQTITFGAIPPTTYTSTPPPLAATANSGLTVAYASSNSAVATVAGNVVTVVGTGSTIITASQAGNVFYLPAANVTQTLAVAPGSQTITFGPLTSLIYGTTPSFTLSATSSAGLPITFTIGGVGSVGTISGNVVTILNGGITTITASQVGNSLYAPATSVVQPLTVAKANQTITFAPPPTLNSGSAPYALIATSSSGLPVSFTTSNFVLATPSGSLGSTLIINATGGGTVLVTATQNGNNLDYNAAPPVQQTLQINSQAFFYNQPTSKIIALGGNTSFFIGENSIPVATHQWQVSQDLGVTWTNITDGSLYVGTTTTNLSVIGALSSMNGYEYRCVATNSVAAVPSNAATLTFAGAPGFTTNPVDSAATAGGGASFTVVTSGSPVPTLQWQVSTDGGLTWANLTNGGVYSNVTATTMNITGVLSNMAGFEYRAIAFNTAVPSGVASTAGTLTVNTVPAFTTPPANITVAAAGNATFFVAASGSPPPTFQWQVSANGGNTWTNLINSGIYSNVTTTDLTITGATATMDGYKYRAVATNSTSPSGIDSQPALLTVTGLVYTSQPSSQTTAPGGTVSYTAATAGSPVPTYQWQTSTNGGVLWTNLTNGGVYSNVTTATMTVTGVSAGMDGTEYQLLAFNSAVPLGLASSPAFLSVNVNTAPVITASPSNQSVSVGGNATFTAAAFGNPTPTFQWQVSTNAGNTWTNISGATAGTLTITAAQPSQNNTLYRAVASNVAGSANSNSASLTVNTVAFSGVYFGSFAGGGSWALYVYPGNTGILIAYIGGATGGTGVESNVTINPDGSFSASAGSVVSNSRGVKADAAFTISGIIKNGTISGTAGTVSFSGTIDSGTSSTLSGYYPASSAVAGAASSYTVVGGDGQVLILTITSAGADVATGTIGSSGVSSLIASDGSNISVTIGSGGLSVTLTPIGSGGSAISFLGPNPNVAATTRLTNLSARATSGTGANILTVGFITSGGNKQILLRGIGPSLASFGTTGYLASPQLSLFGSTGLLQSNSAWGGSSSLAALFAQVYAFVLPTTSNDDALLSSIQPGSYTAQVGGASNTSGVALAEIYDADTGTSPGGRLINISARAQVGTGSNVLTAGLIITGNAPEVVLIRGVGPTLSQFGVTGALAKPVLTLFDVNGNVLYTNSSWGSSTTPTSTFSSTFTQVGAFALPTGSSDAALLVHLVPGAYTAQVTGANGTTGVALIEVYESQ